MKYTQGILLLCVLVLVGCAKSGYTSKPEPTRSSNQSHQEAKASTLVKFERSAYLSDAMAKAKEEGKYIFMDFYTDYCPPCKLMDQEVFSNRELAAYMNRNFVNLKVDCAKTEGANLATMYSVRAYPTLVFIDSNGQTIMRKEGGTSLSTMKSMAEEVVRATAMR